MATEPTSEMTLERLQRELNDFFSNDKAILDEWLDSAIPRLAGECPRSFFDTSERREMLYDVIQEMKI